MKDLTLILLLLLAGSFSNVQAQLADSVITKIDSLFLAWNRPNHPGGVVGLIHKDKLLYCKPYGLASLEYLVPNSSGTKFNIASVSKQFTSMGIVLLEREGKLSIDEDIRTYLPDLPDFGDKITLRHLMHHTSGLRSLHAMLGMAGWRDDDSRDNKDLVRFMKKQRELNFKPGEEYLYCNTGYILMAEIIEKLTGEKFTAWMKTSIFEPLGMVHTYVEDDYSRVVPDNATSYYGTAESGFSRAIEYWGYVGSGNIHSTAKDLLIWSKNFYDPSPVWEAAFQKLQTVDPLNNGDPLNYAFGIGIDTVYDEKRISHGGSIGGYRSFLATFPEKEISLVILANFSTARAGQKVGKIANILLGQGSEKKPDQIAALSPKTISLSKEKLAPYVGLYWNEKESYSRKIYLKEDSLYYHRGKGNESFLLPIAPDKFLMAGVESSIIIEFQQADPLNKQMLVKVNDQKPLVFESYQPVKITDELLQSYVGSYYSPELDTNYRISAKDGQLAGYHYRHGAFKIALLRYDDLESSLGNFRKIKVKRDNDGKIIGIYVSNGRVRNLWFEKVS